MTEDDTIQDPGPESRGAAAPPDIPGCELECIIGRGGMGLVYKGSQPFLNRVVAVKILEIRTRAGDFEARFRREARILAGMDHRNIVGCYQAGSTEEGNCFLVMEYIEGPDLREWIQENGALAVEKAVEVCRDVARALQYAQREGIIHRDVKPANVFLGLDPKKVEAGNTFPYLVKLGDLGLARPTSREVETDMDLTHQGSSWMGTPSTMSPEQYDEGAAVDHRADIYGLGCVLYQAVTGELAYPQRSPTEILARKTARYGPDPRKLRPDVPREIARLIRRMLANDPAERPQTYDDVLAAFEEFHHEADQPVRPRLGVAIIGGSIAAAVLVAIVTYFVWPRYDLDLVVPSEVRSGWPVELGAKGDTTHLSNWNWAARRPDLQIKHADHAAPQASFEAPTVDGRTEVTLMVSAFEDSGGRQGRATVCVYPRLELEPTVGGRARERESARLSVEVEPEELRFGAAEYRWSLNAEGCDGQIAVVGPDGQVTLEEASEAFVLANTRGQELDVELPEAATDYTLAFEVHVFEGGRELDSGSGSCSFIVSAFDDPPEFASSALGGDIQAKPGESISLGGEITDSDSVAQAVHKRWELTSHTGLIANVRRGIEAKLRDASTGDDATVSFDAPGPGSALSIELDIANEGQSNKTTYAIRVPSMSVEVPEGIAEGQTVALEAEVPDYGLDETVHWELVRASFPDDEEGIGRFVTREGTAPTFDSTSGATTDGVPPVLKRADELRLSDLVPAEGTNWPGETVTFDAPLANRPYDLVIGARVVKDDAIIDKYDATFAISALDQDPQLVLIASPHRVDPMGRVTVKACAFDLDSEMVIVPGAFAWSSEQVEIPADLSDDAVTVVAPTQGPLHIRAQVMGLSEEVEVLVRGSLEIVAQDISSVTEGEAIPLSARVDGPDGEDDGWVFAWTVDGVEGGPVWSPDGAASARAEWEAPDRLDGARPSLIAPLATSDYTLDLTLTASKGEASLSEHIQVAVAAKDAAPVLELRVPERCMSGREYDFSCTAKDTDGKIVQYEWLEIPDGKHPVRLGVVDAAKGAPFVWACPQVDQPMPYRIICRVRYADLSVFDSEVLTITALPPIDLKAVPPVGRVTEASTFSLGGKLGGATEGSLSWRLDSVSCPDGSSDLTLSDANPGRGATRFLTADRTAEIEELVGEQTGEGPPWTLRAPQADAPYVLRFEILAEVEGETYSEYVDVAVSAKDDPAEVIGVPSSIVYWPDAAVPIAAQVSDPDSSAGASTLRWELEGVPSHLLADPSSAQTVIDTSSFDLRTEFVLKLDIGANGTVEHEIPVIIDPALSPLGSGGSVALIPDIHLSSGPVGDWIPAKCFPEGASRSPAPPDFNLRFTHTNIEDWVEAKCKWREHSVPKGMAMFAHPVPSVSGWRVSGECAIPKGFGTAKAAGVYLLETLPGPGREGRGIGVEWIPGTPGVDGEERYVEVVRSFGQTWERSIKSDDPKYPMAMIEGENKRSPTDFRRSDRDRDDVFPTPESSALSDRRLRFTITYRQQELTLQWSGETFRWSAPADFRPGAIALGVREGSLFVRDIVLELR